MGDEILNREIKIIPCKHCETGEAKVEIITMGRFGGDSAFPIGQYYKQNCLSKKMKSHCVVCEHNTI